MRFRILCKRLFLEISKFALPGSHCYALKPYPHNLCIPGNKYPALRRVLTLSLDSDGVVAEDIQFAFRESLLVKLATLGGRGDRVEDSRVGDASFGVIRNQLISVGCNADTGITGLLTHGGLLVRGHAEAPLRTSETQQGPRYTKGPIEKESSTRGGTTQAINFAGIESTSAQLD